MANHKGSEGVVKVGANTIAEVRGWEFEHSAELIEDTTLADADKTFQAGNKGGSGTITCWWDETDATGQETLDAGAEVTLTLYPEGATTGDVTFTVSAIITSVRRSAAINGIVEAIYSWTANGAITQGTAP